VLEISEGRKGRGFVLRYGVREIDVREEGMESIGSGDKRGTNGTFDYLYVSAWMYW
jgi:hypothetical protein